MDVDKKWVEEKYAAYAVAFGLNIRNQTNHELNHVETYVYYGQMDEGFDSPRQIGGGASATLVSRNAYGYVTGASGLAIWQIGKTHYHFLVGWSAPRNFYTHSNTIMVGISSGKPIQLEESSIAKLFTKMYYDPPGSSFFNRLTCDYGKTQTELNFLTNRFHAGVQLQQDHKSYNTVTLSPVSRSLPAHLQEDSETLFGYEKAYVKLVTHTYQTAYKRSLRLDPEASNADALLDEKNHVALLLEPKSKPHQRDDTVYLIELTGVPGSKRDIDLSDAARPTCTSVSKAAFAHERKGLELKAYNMGEVAFNKEDLKYFCERIQVDGKAKLEDRCFDWIRQMCELLNIPNQDVLGVARDCIFTPSYTSFNNDGSSAHTYASPHVPMAGYEGGFGRMAPMAMYGGTESYYMFNPWALMASDKLNSLKTQL